MATDIGAYYAKNNHSLTFNLYRSMNLKSCFLSFLIIICMCSCSQNRAAFNNQTSTRDSVIIYKKQGLQKFIEVADYWGNDTESYWAYDQANAILDSITDYSKYEESLARIYSATSYVFYGLSYLPSIITAATQEPESFPKVGIKETGEIIIRDSKLPENYTLYDIYELELRSLYSILYFFKAADFMSFNDIFSFYKDCVDYGELFSEFSPEIAYKVSSVINMKAWYIFLLVIADESYIERYSQYPDNEEMPWKEINELAMWHDSITGNLKKYKKMTEEDFQKIELKAAYTQYILLSHISDNLSENKSENVE